MEPMLTMHPEESLGITLLLQEIIVVLAQLIFLKQARKLYFKKSGKT